MGRTLLALAVGLCLATTQGAWAQQVDAVSAGVVVVNGTTLPDSHYYSRGNTLLFPVIDILTSLGHTASYDSQTLVLTVDGKTVSVEPVMIEDKPYLLWHDLQSAAPEARFGVGGGKAVFDGRKAANVAIVAPTPSPTTSSSPPMANTVTTSSSPPVASTVTTSDLAAGSAKMQSGDYVGALASFEETLSAHPQDPVVLLRACQAANGAHQYDKAIDYATRCRAADSTNYVPWSYCA